MQNFYLFVRNCLLKIIILDIIFLWDKKLSPMIRGKSLTVMSLLFWLIVFFRKKVPAKGLDPASQSLLSTNFERSKLRKNATLSSWTLLQHIWLHFWAWLLNTIAITPIGEDKYVQKCSTRQSFIFPKFTSLKIGTLVL